MLYHRRMLYYENSNAMPWSASDATWDELLCTTARNPVSKNLRKNVVALSTQRWPDGDGTRIIVGVAQMCVSVHCIWSWTILYVTVQKAYRCPIRKGDGTGCAHTMLSVSLSRSSQKLWERGWLPFLESSRQKCLPGQNNSMQCYKMTPMSRYPIFKFQGQKGTRIWFRRRK